MGKSHHTAPGAHHMVYTLLRPLPLHAKPPLSLPSERPGWAGKLVGKHKLKGRPLTLVEAMVSAVGAVAAQWAYGWQ